MSTTPAALAASELHDKLIELSAEAAELSRLALQEVEEDLRATVKLRRGDPYSAAEEQLTRRLAGDLEAAVARAQTLSRRLATPLLNRD